MLNTQKRRNHSKTVHKGYPSLEVLGYETVLKLVQSAAFRLHSHCGCLNNTKTHSESDLVAKLIKVLIISKNPEIE